MSQVKVLKGKTKIPLNMCAVVQWASQVMNDHNKSINAACVLFITSLRIRINSVSIADKRILTILPFVVPTAKQ